MSFSFRSRRVCSPIERGCRAGEEGGARMEWDYRIKLRHPNIATTSSPDSPRVNLYKPRLESVVEKHIVTVQLEAVLVLNHDLLHGQQRAQHDHLYFVE